MNKIAIISASAVAIRGRAYIFAGLPGSGKSTIVNKLAKMVPNAKIITQNYALISDTKILSFPEAKIEGLEKEYPVDSIFVTSYGLDFEIKKIGTKEAFSEISAINYFTQELPVNSPLAGLALVDDFGFMTDDSNLRRISELLPVNNLTVDIGGEKFLRYFREHYV